MKKICSILVIAIGITLFVIGYTTKIPSKNLTTFSILEGDKYSAIDEYVGGDAYNYIIGASLVSGKIAAAKIERVIFISTGSLIFSIGIIGFAFSFKTKEKKPKEKKMLASRVTCHKLTNEFYKVPQNSIDKMSIVCYTINDERLLQHLV